jgi:lipid II:glycine glycyltransferase (peptidoglycan interpeptide bridge formation enzyme)
MKLIDFFGPKAKSADLRLSVYQALYKQALLATGIMLDFAGTRMYLFGGSATEHRNVMAPYALHWYAIQDAQKHGLSTYDFGGSETAGGKDDFGFTRFKLGFGGEEHSYPGAFDLVTKPLWYTIYTISRRINRIRNKML